MDKVRKFGRIKTNMKDNMRTIYKTDKVNIHGIMVICIRVNG